ncbi:hypothetical protein L1987_57911 [Smallanthus sonchifolius]|uniref:Uncharacterized protein n=1 Tax=Smallanthus sonchifolius TaxID=185202 RepID=A0ACB9DDU4_9ASTR|nr:hypothetical protein L1987_57911 [Smallanthus sonchifolius]
MLVVQMEKYLINFWEQEPSNSTPKNFLRIFVTAAQGDIMPSCSTFDFLSWFRVELSLLDYNCLRFLPSMVAASTAFVAKYTIQPEKHLWGLKMQRYSVILHMF